VVVVVVVVEPIEETDEDEPEELPLRAGLLAFKIFLGMDAMIFDWMSAGFGIPPGDDDDRISVEREDEEGVLLFTSGDLLLGVPPPGDGFGFRLWGWMRLFKRTAAGGDE
jgi:hypothetical protein